MEKPEKKILALVPARGGSKGIPQKNIVSFLGKPLILHTLEQARKCSLVDRVVVTTDCPEIAALARENDFEVPFLRPSELATDQARIVPVIAHALRFLAEVDHYQPDGLLLLQPTSPLRRVDDIRTACVLFLEDPTLPVVSISRVDCPAAHLLVPKGDGFSPLYDEDPRSPRQQLTPCYRLNGSVYLSPPATILEEGILYRKDRCRYFIMDSLHSIDIDEPKDLVMAQFLVENL